MRWPVVSSTENGLDWMNNLQNLPFDLLWKGWLQAGDESDCIGLDSLELGL